MNTSLARFSSFISGCVVAGVVTFLLGVILLAAGGNSFNVIAVTFGSVSIYLSSLAFGLAVIGALLRQTAKVVVEGLGGNLSESVYAIPERSSSPSKGESDNSHSAGPLTPTQTPTTKVLDRETLQRIRVSWLTKKETLTWQAAGSPDISDWDGNLKFDVWLSQRKA